MKKLIFLILSLIALCNICIAGDNIDTVVTSSKSYFRDTLTTAIDTMDIAFEFPERFDSFEIEALSSAADTISVYVQSADAAVWIKQAVIDLSTGGYVTTLNMATAWRAFEIIDPRPNKIRLISASDDGSTCIVIVSGKRTEWK